MTPKQQRFVEEYSVDWNATQAAIRAGYSVATAYSQGQRLLKNVEVCSALEMHRNAVSEELGLTERTIVDGLLKEAQREGDGAKHSARVSAWSWLGKYKRMFEDDDKRNRAPAPVQVNVNILNNNA